MKNELYVYQVRWIDEITEMVVCKQGLVVGDVAAVYATLDAEYELKDAIGVSINHIGGNHVEISEECYEFIMNP